MPFFGNKDPNFDFWKLVFVMLIWQLKTLPDIIFWVTDLKIGIFTAKKVSFRILGFHGYFHVTSISEKMVGDANFFFIIHSSLLTISNIILDHKDNSDGMILNLNLTLNTNLTLDEIEILIFRDLKKLFFFYWKLIIK